MSPGILARAAGDWRNQPDGHEIVNLRFESSVLANAQDARFDWLVMKFLENVAIPNELVRFTEGMYSSYVTPEAAAWLHAFKFTGSVAFDPDQLPKVPGRTVLVAISAPLCEVRVIWSPIEMLNDLVSLKAGYWRRARTLARPESVHHEPIGEWPFEAWIDLQIARACGFPNIGHAGIVPSMNLLSNVRQHVSIVGQLPKDATELSLLSIGDRRRLRAVRAANRCLDAHQGDRPGRRNRASRPATPPRPTTPPYR